MYLVFEGIDTAGKSTQMERIHLQFPHAQLTKEPGGTSFGKRIRDMVLGDHLLEAQTELLLFLADRREHYIHIIKPALKDNRMLISDRSFISGMAYALANGTLEYETLLKLNLMTLDDTLPDGVVLFHLPEVTLRERLMQKTHDGIEKRGIAYLLTVQEHLHNVIRALNVPHIRIDASASIEAIHDEIVRFITTLKESRA